MLLSDQKRLLSYVADFQILPCRLEQYSAMQLNNLSSSQDRISSLLFVQVLTVHLVYRIYTCVTPLNNSISVDCVFISWHDHCTAGRPLFLSYVIYHPYHVTQCFRGHVLYYLLCITLFTSVANTYQNVQSKPSKTYLC